MELAAGEKFFWEQGPPLRIKESISGRNYLVCPSNKTYDTIFASIIEDQKVVHFNSHPIDNRPTMDLLYSKDETSHILTATGYSFTGSVSVYSWKKAIFPRWIKDQEEMDKLDILELVDMLHVDLNRTGEGYKLNRLLDSHIRNINGREVEYIDLVDVIDFYENLTEHISQGSYGEIRKF